MSTPVNRSVNIYINQDNAEASLNKLTAKSEKLQKSIDAGNKAGKDMTKQMTELGNTKAKIEQLEGVISGKMAPSLKMVKQNVTQLRNELQGMSADAPGYAAKFKAFEAASTKLKEMEASVKGVKTQLNVSGGGGFFGKMKDGLLSGLGIGAGIGLLTTAVASVKQMVTDSMQLARQAEGVKAAFNNLNEPGLLSNLREATRGTVSDLVLMKTAVKADNFQMPLEKLGTLLDFARRRAKDTGESVDYLVESIVLGISRKSIPIMDNLGISAVEIQEEFKKTGDFAEASFNIVARAVKKAGGEIDTAAEQLEKHNARMANFGVRVGNLFNTIFLGMTSDIRAAIDLYETQQEDLLKIQQMGERKSLKSAYSYIDEYEKADADGRIKIQQQAMAHYQFLLKVQDDAYKAQGDKGKQKIQRDLDEMADVFEQMAKLPQKYSFKSFAQSDLSKMTREQLELLKEQGNIEMNPLMAEDSKAIAAVHKRQAMIDAAIAKFDKPKVNKTDHSQHRAEILREFELLKAEVETITTDETKQLSAEQDKQLQAVSNKYLALTEKAKKYKVNLLGLNETQEKELAALQEKFFKQRSEKEYADSLKSLDLFYTGEKDKLLQQHSDKTITKTEYDALLLQLERDHAADRLQVATDYAPEVKAAEEAAQKGKTEALVNGIADQQRVEQRANNERLYGLERNILTQRKGSKAELEARKEFLNEQFAQETAHLDKSSNEYLLKQQKHTNALADMDRQYLVDKVQGYMDATMQIYSLWQNVQALQQKAADTAHRNEMGRMDEEGERWKKLLDEKKVSQEFFNQKMGELDEKKRAKEQEYRKKQFEQEKKAALAQVAISTAQAIIGVWAQNPNPVYGGIMTGVIAGIGIYQASQIAAQEFPEMEKGGLLDGKSHAEGGIPLVAEGGEAILSKATVKNNRGIVNALLQSSMNRGGATLPDWMFSQPPGIRNDIPVFSRPNYTQMGNGGMVQNSTAAGGGSAGSTPLIDAQAMMQFVAAVNKFEKLTEDGIRANVFYDDIDKQNRELSAIKNRSRMGGK